MLENFNSWIAIFQLYKILEDLDEWKILMHISCGIWCHGHCDGCGWVELWFRWVGKRMALKYVELGTIQELLVDYEAMSSLYLIYFNRWSLVEDTRQGLIQTKFSLHVLCSIFKALATSFESLTGVRAANWSNTTRFLVIRPYHFTVSTWMPSHAFWDTV